MTQLTDNIWAVEVPDRIKNPHFYRVNNEAIMFKWEDADHPLNIHDVVCVYRFHGDLKDHKWPTFLFTTKGATKEDKVKVVGNAPWINHVPQNLLSDDHKCWVETVDECFDSLLVAKGCNTERNYAILKLNDNG